MEYLQSDEQLSDENDYLHIDTDPPNHDWVPGLDDLSSKESLNLIDFENHTLNFI